MILFLNRETIQSPPGVLFLHLFSQVLLFTDFSQDFDINSFNAITGQRVAEGGTMNNTVSKTVSPLLVCVVSFMFNQAYAVAHPYEFHADSKMQLQSYGPVDDAYGYMYVETDIEGNGTITVMFSNASEVDLARFNAHVKFLDAGGAVIGEEYFDCWIDREGLREAIECKLSRPLAHSGFDSIQVDFFLSDVTDAISVSEIRF